MGSSRESDVGLLSDLYESEYGCLLCPMGSSGPLPVLSKDDQGIVSDKWWRTVIIIYLFPGMLDSLNTVSQLLSLFSLCSYRPVARKGRVG